MTKVTIEWTDQPTRGWWATYPTGARRYWHHNHGMPFMSWIMGFLKKDGDIVEVHYPKTITTYAMTSRPKDRS